MTREAGSGFPPVASEGSMRRPVLSWYDPTTDEVRVATYKDLATLKA